MFDKKAMQSRYAELYKRRDEIMEAAAPLRAERDAFVAKARETEMALNAKVRVAEEGLSEICEELGIIARALNGKTGDPNAT